MRQPASYFPKTTAKEIHKWHANRPRKLNVLDILTDHLSVGQIKAFQSLPYRFPAAFGTVETRRKTLGILVHKSMYLFWYALSNRLYSPASTLP